MKEIGIAWADIKNMTINGDHTWEETKEPVWKKGHRQKDIE